jgi:type II secretory pathway component PulF
MPEVLQNIANELENFAKIKSKVKSAMMYPTVVIIFAIIAVLVLLRKVVPTIVDLFPSKEDLPAITKFVLAMSDFVQTK